MLSYLKLHTENNMCMFILLTDHVARNFRHFRWCNLGLISISTRKPCYRKETAQCSMFFLHPMTLWLLFASA